VRSLGIFQDGGLRHNNPASIAQWETQFLWSRKAEPDFMLSLGTGTSTMVPAHEVICRPRFYKRLFASFMRSLDGEDAWESFLNNVPLKSRHRYHRLNIKFPGPEPSLDDADRLPELKETVSSTIHQDRPSMLSVVDSMLASMFYFELDRLPARDSYGFSCSGLIFCRLDLPADGLRQLHLRLTETSSWFIVQGKPIACSQGIPEGLPPFRKRVTFRVESKDELITLSLRGIISKPRQLSGFPTTLDHLIKDQQLNHPFGTIDHRSDKLLPATPVKRCGVFNDHHETKRRKR
jgi:hypothetical protein